jgi:hypothetical protein
VREREKLVLEPSQYEFPSVLYCICSDLCVCVWTLFIVCTNTNLINKNTLFTRGFFTVFFSLVLTNNTWMLNIFSGFYLMLNSGEENCLKLQKVLFGNLLRTLNFPGMEKRKSFSTNSTRTFPTFSKHVCVWVCLFVRIHVCLLIKLHFLSFHRFQDVNLVASYSK